VLTRARALATLSRAPGAHVDRQRARLHQLLREARAGSRRRLEEEWSLTARRTLVLQRKADSAVRDCRERRARELERLALALSGHDPQRTLERGYALIESASGEALPSAARARKVDEVRMRFADDTLKAKIVKR
jgi:exodeoxyribonuclease VII large subunit